ncbi:MAG: oligosaccharide flippase family protein [Polyangiales bacterium]
MTAPPAASVLRRIARETTSFAALQTVASLVVWGSTLVLARLLDKRAFGTFAIGSFFLGLGGLLGDGGLGATLLRRKGDVTDEEYRVTATFLLAVGLALGATLALGTPYLAARYHLRPDEAGVLRLLAPLFLVGPLRAVPYIRLERELHFGTIARIELLATLLRQAAAVLLAWRVGGAWALAGAQLTGALAQTGLAYVASPGLPGLAWRPRVLRGLLGYGVRVQALGVVAFFKDNISALLLGALVGPGAVGVFDFGVKYAQLPVAAVNALARVQLPTYARFEARDPALHAAVTAATRTALAVGLAILVALGAGARAIIPFFYDARWLESAPVVWGLGANMAGGLLAGPLFSLLQAQGRAGTALGAFCAWTTVTWALAVATHDGGPAAIAWSYSVATVAMVAWLVAWAGRHLGRPLWPAYVGPLTAAAVAVAAAYGAARLGWRDRGWALAGVALVAYVAALFAVEGRRVRDELRALAAAAGGR